MELSSPSWSIHPSVLFPGMPCVQKQQVGMKIGALGGPQLGSGFLEDMK